MTAAPAPSLLELQSGFADALFGRSDAAACWVVGAGLEPAARLQIYRNTVANTQADALRSSYPAVLALVGEDFFAAAAARYRLWQPSRHGNLQEFGDGFPDFLYAMPEAQSLLYLADVARLDWLRQESALAADAPSLDAVGLMSTLASDPARLWLGLHPSVRLLDSEHSVLSIWRYSQSPTAAGLHLEDRGEHVALWRAGSDVAMAALDPASYACIGALADGCDLDAANERALVVDSEFDLMACLQSLIAQTLIAAYTTEERKA